jgi:hypothetical protein
MKSEKTVLFVGAALLVGALVLVQGLRVTEATSAEPYQAAAAVEPGAAELEGITGTVAETLAAAGYTYLRLQTPGGDVWAAVAQAEVAVGSQATIVNASLMKDFESRTLGRKFESIYFGALGTGGAACCGEQGAGTAAMAAGGDPHAGLDMGKAHGGLGLSGPAALERPIVRAEGQDGRTIAELYAAKAELQGKSVAVRGKVVKFNGGILGKNWLHIQDGSGSAESGDFDLTVTTQGFASVGDVVLVRGVLSLDRDFGAGYVYPVIVEDAAFEAAQAQSASNP